MELHEDFRWRSFSSLVKVVGRDLKGDSTLETETEVEQFSQTKHFFIGLVNCVFYIERGIMYYNFTFILDRSGFIPMK